jgi:hypothetical protein
MPVGKLTKFGFLMGGAILAYVAALLHSDTTLVERMIWVMIGASLGAIAYWISHPGRSRR